MSIGFEMVVTNGKFEQLFLWFYLSTIIILKVGVLAFDD